MIICQFTKRIYSLYVLGDHVTCVQEQVQCQHSCLTTNTPCDHPDKCNKTIENTICGKINIDN